MNSAPACEPNIKKVLLVRLAWAYPLGYFAEMLANPALGSTNIFSGQNGFSCARR
jgi:hypothetical protein